jgi:phospholipid/cholesterol/gamma-HCH transport system substrate-binding protein
MKKSQMREMSIEVTVGAFIFMILLALGVFTIILSQDNFFVKNYEVQVRFNEVSGLRSGDKVFLRGVDIGKISNIEIESDGVLLTATLEKDITFTEDYAIEIIPVSVLGGKRLVINPGSSAEDPLPAGTILAGTPPKDVITEATDTIAMIRKSLDDGKVLDNLSRVVADLRTVSEKISSGEGTIGKLVMDDSLYTNVNHVVSDLKNVSERLSNGEGTLGKLLMDESAYDELQASMSNLREISDRLAAGKGTLGRLLSEDEKMYQDLEASVANLREISDKLAGGEGTIGRLVQDDELYDELKLLLVEARAAVDDFRETSPITTFSSIFFGAF